MDELKWTLLVEVLGNDEAEMVKSYLEANDIGTTLIQEGYQHSAMPITYGRVQIFVTKDQLEEARKLLEESGQEIEIADEDANNKEEDQ